MEGDKETEDKSPEKKRQEQIKTIEEQIAELESEDSELEELRNKQTKKRLFNDKQWKVIVAIIGSGINVSLIVLTLNMIELLLSGGSH